MPLLIKANCHSTRCQSCSRLSGRTCACMRAPACAHACRCAHNLEDLSEVPLAKMAGCSVALHRTRISRDFAKGNANHAPDTSHTRDSSLPREWGRCRVSRACPESDLRSSSPLMLRVVSLSDVRSTSAATSKPTSHQPTRLTCTGTPCQPSRWDFYRRLRSLIGG